MLFNEVAVHDRRVRLREGSVRIGGCVFLARTRRWWRCSSRSWASTGYITRGAVIANDLGLSDVGLTTLPEVSHRARATSRVTALPAIVDVDTGFGGPMNVARTVRELDELGLAGCHLEDQICATPTTRRSTKASTTSGARGTIAANETINVVKASRATRVRRRPQPRTGPR
jgi:methylisocitrate lyase